MLETSSFELQNGANGAGYAQPRPRKPGNQQVLRTQNNALPPKNNVLAIPASSGLSRY